MGPVRPCVLRGKNWMEFYMRPEAEMGKVAPEPPVEPKEKDWATFHRNHLHNIFLKFSKIYVPFSLAAHVGCSKLDKLQF